MRATLLSVTATVVAVFLMLCSLFVDGMSVRVGMVGGAVVIVVVVAWRLNLVARRDRERIDQLTALEIRRADQVAMLSHEVRTPLAIILGSAELLGETATGTLTKPQHAFVRKIIDNAHRLNALAEQLLIRARIEAGMFTLVPSRIDLRRFLYEVVEDLIPVVDATVVVDAPGAPTVASVDANLIRQVVSNLVTNASRTESVSGLVEVRLLSGEDEAIIAVSDGGQGMTEKQRDRLFERFASGQPLGNGAGIGLYLSQQLVQLHGGRLYVDTITGRGTTVLFTLPLRAQDG